MKIPVQMQPIYEGISGIIVEYCEKYLNDYRVLCLRLLEKLCRKRPSPLLQGRRNTWAGGSSTPLPPIISCSTNPCPFT